MREFVFLNEPFAGKPDDGEWVSEVIPEFWLLHYYSLQIIGPASQKRVHDQDTVVNRD